MDAIVRVEDPELDPLVIHVNHFAGTQPKATTVQEAADIARRFIAAGYTVDLGLAQLNSANLPRLGYSVEDAFDPCKNLAAGARVLSGFYGKAVQQFGEGQRALMSALSGYNTGDLSRGFANGYVGKYYIDATLPAASLAKLTVSTPHAAPSRPPNPVTVAYDRPGLDLRIN